MPDVQPYIDQIAALVGGLTSGKPTSLTDDQAAKLLKDRPDVLAEYNRLLPTIDWNSPWAGQHGFAQGGGPNGFANWWFTQGGGNKEYTFGDPTTGTPTPTPQTVADDVKTTATDATKTAIDNLTNTTTSLLDQLKAQNASLTGLISDQAGAFTKSQADLLAQLNQAKADSAAQQGVLVKQLQDQISGQGAFLNGALGEQAKAMAATMAANGQTSKKPNYQRAVDQNKILNSTGLGSTMLTGPSGVAPSALTLGFTNLLGS